MAQAMYDALPPEVIDIVAPEEGPPKFKGGALVKLADPTTPARKADVVANRVWVESSARTSPQKNHSSFFYADVYKMLDDKLKGNLLVPNKVHTTKAELALYEGHKHKEVMGCVEVSGSRYQK